mgnify:FL=1|tara:strand:+ start:3838 stop:4158 length:321 start_codon:yes stop_codon:yes gene_type:complete
MLKNEQVKNKSEKGKELFKGIHSFETTYELEEKLAVKFIEYFDKWDYLDDILFFEEIKDRDRFLSEYKDTFFDMYDNINDYDIVFLTMFYKKFSKWYDIKCQLLFF